ncbi:MAG: transmembrane 220 family protein [Woeseiaceae bacterium]
MRLPNLGAASLFLIAAAVQFNDPDPLYWILVYAGTAAIALARGLGHHSVFWTGVCSGAVAAGIAWTLPAFGAYLTSGNLASILGDMSSGPHVEEAREFIGLVLALVLLGAYAFADAQKRY